MFFYIVDEGQKVLMKRSNGTLEVVEGPAKLWRFGKRFSSMDHHVAHPGEFLVVRFRDGTQENAQGPCHIWLDPRKHLGISKEECIQLSEKEAIVLYSKDDDVVSRRIVNGPAEFVPEPGEWLHTFSWHGSRGGADGYRKVPNALVFQKLWLLPDQMYHDIPDVRTADGVVITIRLMIFFELIDIETMLVTTHDPIGDFVNAATSDVVDFVGRLEFEEFKSHTERLNQSETYRQLVSRADSCGYRINKVVYRGYGAPGALQKMHEQAMEARTKLQLEKATEEQAQKLQDFKLEKDIYRTEKESESRAKQLEQELELRRKKQVASLESQKSQKEFERVQAKLDEEQALHLNEEQNQRREQHLQNLKELGVDLTKYLTQNRADKIIELRGQGVKPHIHLPKDDE